jgi:hypothetical protein
VGLFVGPFEECRDGGLAGPLPQRFDNVVDAVAAPTFRLASSSTACRSLPDIASACSYARTTSVAACTITSELCRNAPISLTISSSRLWYSTAAVCTSALAVRCPKHTPPWNVAVMESPAGHSSSSRFLRSLAPKSRIPAGSTSKPLNARLPARLA